MKNFEFKKPILVFIGAKIFIFLAALCVFVPFQREPTAGHLLLHDSTAQYNLWLDIWRRWDAFQFLYVAEHGYTTTSDGLMLGFTAFPMFPLLIKLFTYFTGDYYASGLIIVNTAFLVSMIVLYNLVQLHFSCAAAFRTIVFMCMCPLSFLFSMVYTEPVYLMFSILAFYFAYKGKWLMASAFGCAAAMTRVVGIVLFIPLVIIYLETINYEIKKIRPDILYLLFIPLGLVYVFYLHYLVSGSFFVYFTIAARVTLEPSLPWTSIVETIRTIVNFVRKGQFPEYAFIQLFFCFLVLSIFAVGCRKLKNLPYITYTFLMILLTLSANNLASFQRYSLVLFPLFIVLAILGGNRKFTVCYCGACIPMAIYFLYRFKTGMLHFRAGKRLAGKQNIVGEGKSE